MVSGSQEGVGKQRHRKKCIFQCHLLLQFQGQFAKVSSPLEPSRRGFMNIFSCSLFVGDNFVAPRANRTGKRRAFPIIVFLYNLAIWLLKTHILNSSGTSSSCTVTRITKIPLKNTTVAIALLVYVTLNQCQIPKRFVFHFLS